MVVIPPETYSSVRVETVHPRAHELNWCGEFAPKAEPDNKGPYR